MLPSRILFCACAILMSSTARAGLLIPTAFTSLGTLSDGGWTEIDTDAATLTTGVGGGAPRTYHGVISNGVAIFDFTSVDVSYVDVTGTNPLAILSRGDLTLGTLWANEVFNQTDKVPGAGQGGGAPGGAGAYDPPPSSSGGPGGSGAANLLASLGGGANGSGNIFPSEMPNGSGGAAIELVAAGNLSAGTILAGGSAGQVGQGYFFPGGGGGGGGGVILAGDFVTGSVDVSGGAGGHGGFHGGIYGPPDGAGGGGGGGEVDVLYRSGYSVTANVSGGAPGGNNGDQILAQAGADGRLIAMAVPEPSAFARLGSVAIGLLIWYRWNHRVKSSHSLEAL